MENTSVIGIIQRHGDDDYSVWYPDIPSDDPLLVALFEKYASSGASVRGSGTDICADIGKTCDRTSLSCPDSLQRGKLIAHIIVYHDPAENHVGLDVFVDFETALKQFKRTLNDTIKYNSGDPEWIQELVMEEDTFNLYFRDKSNYECFYRREVIQEAIEGE